MNQATDDGWIQLTIRVAAGMAEAAEEELFASGAASVTLLDAADHPVHEPDPGETPLWPQVLVRGLFSHDLDRAAISERLHGAGLVQSADAVAFDTLADQDWERAWMDRFQPMRFGRDLWICPWHIEPEPDWPVVIRLDPGLAFGSGTHPTTALCLEWIDQQDFGGKQVIDYGCGSGILAIACALKGAERVVAIDHDPQALTATLDNARRNGVAPRIVTALPNTPEAEQALAERAGVVVANILAGPLIELSARLCDAVAPAGQIALSGILEAQAADVEARYREHLRPQRKDHREDWVLLSYCRAGNGGSSPD
ncbi:50S ribosomal protein L11 methyltransferase [Wenzhouxiangella sp. AB-CW3]|uniref:50S ribosomal protein L11 methyltransferase n=1 Tax=Wenzhouxiangella sp. AB-CW3 TaxID=2771012 RepID=UPI00168B984D|nr:50S ribosomal protein L11 methyltransferase [Wenzhouxiangella sp. AB-CW3]QOC23131.1 50S ribosomal protein L11 methyltransferase [Wenzhouxiangella sp. AB-CW3]